MKIILFLLLTFSFSCNKISTDDSLEIILNDEIVEIYLIKSLNDIRGYCIDMSGYKTDADITKPLQAHSCYSYQGKISVDQGFNESKIIEEEFYIPFFNVCMEVEKIEKSSKLLLNKCSKNSNQKFILNTDGRIQPKLNSNLCLTISDEFREGGGGNPVHLIRNLSIEECNNNLSILQTWGIRKN